MNKLLKVLLLVPVVIIEIIFTVVEIVASTIAGTLAIIRVWFHNDYSYLKWLQMDLSDCESILELGCGSNSPLLKIGCGYKTDAVDIFEPYIDMHNRTGVYRSCEVADILTMPLIPDKEKAYDAVVICDVLEHLPKDKVFDIDLLSAIEKVARKKVILFTPNGFVENEEIDDNHYQEHLSVWEPSNYICRGYKVVGSTGLRWLLGKGSLPKYHPYPIFQILTILTQPLVFKHPKLALHSYAVKEL